MSTNMKNLIMQARRAFNNGKSWSHLRTRKSFTLLHFSDIHGDEVELKRLCDFLDEHSALIDDAICTGDMVELRWNSGYDFWENEPRAKKILSCIGNHDVLTDPEPDGWDWSQKATPEESYEHYFAPFIDEWNCVHEGKNSYYYKDYEKNKLRLIVIDDTIKNDEGQIEWFGKAIDDALAKELSVMVAGHTPSAKLKRIECNFSTLDKETLGGFDFTRYQDKIKSFKEAGGEFIVWIAGHSHIDFVGEREDYKGQLFIVNNALNRQQCNQYSDLERVDGTPSQDCFNVMTIDFSSSLIKLIRVGADTDRYLRKRDTLCINYKTGEVIK